MATRRNLTDQDIMDLILESDSDACSSEDNISADSDTDTDSDTATPTSCSGLFIQTVLLYCSVQEVPVGYNKHRHPTSIKTLRH
jgi:hypothetical protein